MTTKVISKNFKAVKVNKVCYRDRHSFHVLASHFTSLLSFLVFDREEFTERFKRQWPEVVLYRFHYTQCVYLPQGLRLMKKLRRTKSTDQKKERKKKKNSNHFPKNLLIEFMWWRRIYRDWNNTSVYHEGFNKLMTFHSWYILYHITFTHNKWDVFMMVKGTLDKSIPLSSCMFESFWRTFKVKHVCLYSKERWLQLSIENQPIHCTNQ